MKFWAKAALAILPALLLLGCGTSGEVKDEAAAEGGQASEQVSGAESAASTRGAGTDSELQGERMGGGAEEIFDVISTAPIRSSTCCAFAAKNRPTSRSCGWP